MTVLDDMSLCRAQFTCQESVYGQAPFVFSGVVVMPREDRTGHAYRKLRARVLADEDLCARCGEWVDKSLSGKLPDGPSMGHKLAKKLGGPMVRSNLHLEHVRCNSAAENRSRAKQPAGPTASRNW